MRDNLFPFVLETSPSDYMPAWFHRYICAKLTKFVKDIEEKKAPRLMIFVPPRHGKSHIVSERLPAWFLGRNPAKSTAVISYDQDLPNKMSRVTRSIFEDVPFRDIFPSVVLAPDKAAVEEWEVQTKDETGKLSRQRGGHKAVGIGGGITGRGADLMIIDDPIKGGEEAESKTIRDKTHEWYKSTARTRVMPGGGVIVMMTRWHEDDLAGRLLKDAKDNPEADQWEVINLPAIAGEDEYFTPDFKIIHSGEEAARLIRRKGEALHEERWSLQNLKTIKATIGDTWFNAQYQGSPIPAGGRLIKKEWFRYYTEDDTHFIMQIPGQDEPRRILKDWVTLFQTIDTAAKAGDDNDFTVIGTWASCPGGELILLDVERTKTEDADLENWIDREWQAWDGPIVGYEQTLQTIGHIQRWRKKGRPCKALNPGQGDKVARSSRFRILCETGMVFFPVRSIWLSDYISELLAFNKGKHDDQVDMSSWAAYLHEDIRGTKGANGVHPAQSTRR